MHGGVFITGTDTGIGKTVVACAIAAAANRRGLRSGVFKPVETGCRREGDRLIAEDVERLVAAAGSGQTAAEASAALFETASAPLAAAVAVGAEISIDALTDQAGDLIDAYDFTVIEGAGGLLVPIADGVTWLDLAEEFDVPIVCVVGDRLGCINHALLTLDRLENEGAEICGFVINHLQPSTQPDSLEPTDDGICNRALIARFSDQRCLGEFPHIQAGDRDNFTKLAEYAEQALDLDAILGAAGA